jgi:FAD/FMN-containing dehydrogenase
VRARDPDAIDPLVHDAPTLIARGAGRAYGDAAIGCDATLSLENLDRMIAFDPASGRLTVEAGVRLAEILDAFVPRGFFPPVVPGTAHVTVGGMVAANVHGKNHHTAGGFGAHVERLTLITADGARVCAPAENAELFRATVGGMGLTGIIRDVTFRMMPIDTAFIRNETIVMPDLDAVLRGFEDSAGWTYSVAWIDGLARGAATGRSVLFRGEHARADELAGDPARPYAMPKRRALSLPFHLPGLALNRMSVAAFNALYFARQRPGTTIVPLTRYFFPLDAVGAWNRIYGRRGFVQHQSVIPKAAGRAALGEMLDLVSSRGSPSFLAVLKLFGADESGLISFPLEGYTLALDFPASGKTFRLLDELDRIVASHGGRLYLAKDARQSRATMEAGYPGLGAFRELRRASGAATKFRSLQSERLAL